MPSSLTLAPRAPRRRERPKVTAALRAHHNTCEGRPGSLDNGRALGCTRSRLCPQVIEADGCKRASRASACVAPNTRRRQRRARLTDAHARTMSEAWRRCDLERGGSHKSPLSLSAAVAPNKCKRPARLSTHASRARRHRAHGAARVRHADPIHLLSRRRNPQTADPPTSPHLPNSDAGRTRRPLRLAHARPASQFLVAICCYPKCMRAPKPRAPASCRP